MSAPARLPYEKAHGADALMPDRPALLAKARTFHTLDALRGIAAMAVVLFHAGFFLDLPKPAEGQLAVDLFFVMSGFIIAHRYGDELAGGMPLAAFLRVRLVRLYPLYLLGAALGVLPAAVLVATGDRDLFHLGLVAALPFHLLMLPSHFVSPRIDELFPFNYVAWSLALEVLVNVLYAATIRFWTPARLAVLVASAAVALAICAWSYGGLKYGYAWTGWPVGIVRILFGFPLGVLLQRVFATRTPRIGVPWWAILVVATTMFFVPPPVAKPVWEFVCVTIVVPLIVLAAIASEPPRALQGTCAVAGIFSYVVYSLHAPYVGLYLRAEALAHVDADAQSVLRALLFGLGLVALCIIAHVAYDKPVRRRLLIGPAGGRGVARRGKKLSLST